MAEIKVPPIWLICGKTTSKNLSKSVTIGKSLKKSSKWRQAELSSSIRLDFRAKRVKMFTSTKSRKYAEKCAEKIWPVYFHFFLAYHNIIIWKLVTIGKSFKKCAQCRQAHFYSSNHLDFILKWIYLSLKLLKKKIIEKI